MFYNMALNVIKLYNLLIFMIS